MNKVVVTGMGTVSPVGLTVEESWGNLSSGVSGVNLITQFDTGNFQVKIACEVKNFNPDKYMSAREARRRDRFEQFAAVATQEALKNSGLLQAHYDPHRVGVILASAIGGLRSFTDTVLTLEKEGPRRVSPFAIPMLMSNGGAGLVAIDNQFYGPCFSVASACASGTDGIGMAWHLLRGGSVDVVIAGASEATITEVGIAAFDRLGAISRRNYPDEPTPQPFDKNRDGLVMGEGAAVLVLETETHAKNRGAMILAELAGYAATADGYHVTAPADDGAGAARAMRVAMELAEIDPTEIDYINAHGTATPLNDLAETRAIKSVFGERAYQIPVSSTKSMTGHMMGATGALEAIICIQSILNGVIPPTINYLQPDPECDLDYVPNTARKTEVKVAVSNAFGFGGHNAVLVLRRYPGK